MGWDGFELLWLHKSWPPTAVMRPISTAPSSRPLPSPVRSSSASWMASRSCASLASCSLSACLPACQPARPHRRRVPPRNEGAAARHGTAQHRVAWHGRAGQGRTRQRPCGAESRRPPTSGLPVATTQRPPMAPSQQPGHAVLPPSALLPASLSAHLSESDAESLQSRPCPPALRCVAHSRLHHAIITWRSPSP